MPDASFYEAPSDSGDILDEEGQGDEEDEDKEDGGEKEDGKEERGPPKEADDRRKPAWAYLKESLKRHGVHISSDPGASRRAPTRSASQNVRQFSPASGL